MCDWWMQSRRKRDLKGLEKQKMIASEWSQQGVENEVNDRDTE